MKKTVVLRCPKCGNTHTFTVGAGAELGAWRDVYAVIPDKKEGDKITEILVKLSEKRNKAEMRELTRNQADALNNIYYDVLGEDSIKLFTEEHAAECAACINDKAKESIDSSREKWQAAARKEGLIAFEAIYFCPKTRTPKQGMHVSLRYKDDKQRDNVIVLRNKCDDCSSAPVLLDDCDAGFMHEGLPTAAYCKDCSVPLEVDSVSFKIPQKETPEA